MEISAALVMQLREKTGVGMMQCKKALAESAGDLAAAEKLLRKQGAASAARKSDRTTGEGQVVAYVHTGGKIGVLVEVNCETDFAARSADFQELLRGLAMHVAAANPRYVAREEVPESVLADEREIAREQAAKSGKPAAVLDKIAEGKLEKFYEEHVLLEQAYVKDPDRKVGQLVTDTVARIGENVRVRRFARFVLGEEL